MGIGEFIWLLSGGSAFYVAQTYTTQPDQTHAHYSQIAGELATDKGYTAGGDVMVLIDAAITGTDPTVYAKYDAQDTVIAAPVTAGPCRYAIVYVNASTKPLWSFHDYGADKTGGGGTFTTQYDANGVSRIQITDAA